MNHADRLTHLMRILLSTRLPKQRFRCSWCVDEIALIQGQTNMPASRTRVLHAKVRCDNHDTKCCGYTGGVWAMCGGGGGKGRSIDLDQDSNDLSFLAGDSEWAHLLPT